MKNKLTKRRFIQRVYRRNLILATLLAIIVAIAVAVEKEIQLSWTIVCITTFVGIVGVFTGAWADMEAEEAYKEYIEDFEDRSA